MQDKFDDISNQYRPVRRNRISYEAHHQFCLPIHQFEDRDYQLAGDPKKGRKGASPAFWFLVRENVHTFTFTLSLLPLHSSLSLSLSPSAALIMLFVDYLPNSDD